MESPALKRVVVFAAVLALSHTACGELGGVQSTVALDGGALLFEIEDGSPVLPQAVDPGPALSRRKRYVSFPTGSVFSIIICLAKRTLIRYPDFYTFNFDLDVGYKLPNNTQFFIARRKRDEEASDGTTGEGDREPYQEESTIVHRRDRRAFYYQVEEFLQALGLGGRECVLRTICEAKQVLPHGGNLMEDVFRVIFTMPPLRRGMEEEYTGVDGNGFPVDPKDEEASAKEYDAADALGISEVDCYKIFPCTVSLLEVALW